MSIPESVAQLIEPFSERDKNLIVALMEHRDPSVVFEVLQPLLSGDVIAALKPINYDRQTLCLVTERELVLIRRDEPTAGQWMMLPGFKAELRPLRALAGVHFAGDHNADGDRGEKSWVRAQVVWVFSDGTDIAFDVRHEDTELRARLLAIAAANLRDK